MKSWTTAVTLSLFVGLVSLMPVALPAQQKFTTEIQSPDALTKQIPFHSLYRSREHFQNLRFTPEAPPKVTPAPAAKAEEDSDKLRRDWERRKDHKAFGRAVEDALRIPSGTDRTPGMFASNTAWTQIGNGVHYFDGRHKAGRIRWAEYAYDHGQNATVLYVSGSSGGLWKPVFIIFFTVWVPIGDNLPGSPSVSAFQVHPNDSRIILVGTGDSNRYPGTGLYKTTDEGVTWTQCSLPYVPHTVFRLHRDKTDASGNTVLAATSDGIWRTTNFGDTWSPVYTSRAATDLVQDPVYPRYWYAGGHQLGILESSDFGQSFHPINGSGREGITGTIHNINIAVCNSAPNYVYAQVEFDGKLNGVYRSSNYGYNWTKITSGDPYSVGQGFHARAIGVNPNNPNHVLAAMAWCNETTNATSSAVSWTDRTIGHVDFTRFLFPPSGTEVIVCNDGGYYGYDFTTNTVNHLGNILGLNCQLVGRMEGARQSPTRLLSGLQDIGVIRTDSTLSPENTTPAAHHAFGSDGGSVSFSPDTPDAMAWSNGAYGGPYVFHRWLTLNGGLGIADITGYNVIEEGGWNNTVMFDPTPGLGPYAYVYGHSNQYIYWKPATSGSSSDWQRINNGFPLPTHVVRGREVGINRIEVINNPSIYCFYATRWGGADLFVFEGSNIGNMNYVVRTPPLPADATRGDCLVYADRSSYQRNTVYYTTASARPSRAYVSFNRGQTWTDVTGDLKTILPTANYHELIANPSNTRQLFLATNVGLFRSDNFGRNWYRWSQGLPAVVDVQCLRIAYDGVTTPLIQMGTWGRGWWERNLPPVPLRTITGKVAIESVVAAGVNVTFEFRPTDGSAGFTVTRTPNARGDFWIDSIMPGNYNVRVKMPKALAKVIPVNLVSDDALNVSITLKGGDVNGDNVVNTQDRKLLNQSMNRCLGDAKYNPNADLNLDNCVNDLDMTILLGNFDQVGDP